MLGLQFTLMLSSSRTGARHSKTFDADNDRPSHIESGANGMLDQKLRERVDEAWAEFDRCSDAVIAHPTPQNFEDLRDTADRLMRAIARVLIDLG